MFPATSGFNTPARSRTKQAITSETSDHERNKRSRTNKPRDRGRGFGQLVVGVVAALGDRARHAVTQMLVQQIQRHRAQSAVDRADLGEDVDAVFVLFDHARDAAHLTLDAPQPLGVVVLLLRISVWSRHLGLKPPGYAPNISQRSIVQNTLYPSGV